MNTSARLPLPEPLLRFTGTLLHHAEARTKPGDAQGHMVPVLCMDVEIATPQHNHLHVEQPFDTQGACEAAARRYRKGMTVTVDGPVASARMTLTNVSHIHVHQPEEHAA